MLNATVRSPTVYSYTFLSLLLYDLEVQVGYRNIEMYWLVRHAVTPSLLKFLPDWKQTDSHK